MLSLRSSPDLTFPLLGSRSSVASFRASEHDADMVKEACFRARPSGRAKTGDPTYLELELAVVCMASSFLDVKGDTVEHDTCKEDGCAYGGGGEGGKIGHR